MDDDEPLAEPRFDDFNSPEYHDLVGRAGRYAANYLARNRERLLLAEPDGERDERHDRR